MGELGNAPVPAAITDLRGALTTKTLVHSPSTRSDSGGINSMSNLETIIAAYYRNRLEGNKL